MGQKLSQELYEKMVKTSVINPRLSVSKLLAYVMATLVHSLTLIIVIIGLWLILINWFNPLLFAFGLILLTVAWFTRPNFGKISTINSVTQVEFPHLFRLVAKVAAAMQAPRVDIIKIDSRFNASFYEGGFKKRRVLTIGLPLFTILEDREKIALLAHELGHCINRDMRRGFYIGSALNTLIYWYGIIRPAYLWPKHSQDNSLVIISIFLTNVLLLGLSKIIQLGIYILAHLIFRESQRAEYLADAQANRVSGTRAMVAMLEKLHFSEIFTLSVQTVALNPDKQKLFDYLRNSLREVPERELERIRRIRHLDGSRLDVTHPPTVYRTAFIEAHPTDGANVIFSDEEFLELKKELARLEPIIEEKLLDRYKDSLYR
jgi:heat shock protein HtpX